MGEAKEHMRMPFGKYKGRALRDVPDNYLGWLLDECDLQPRLRRAVEKELDTREENALYGVTTSQQDLEAAIAQLRNDLAGKIREWRRECAMRVHPDRSHYEPAVMAAINDAADRLQELVGLVS
jgi:hypothetical protein